MSRQRSARGAKPDKAGKAAKAAKPARGARGAAAAAARPAGRGVYVQQPKSDIFVVLLSIALGAILLGALLMLLVWGRYDFSTSVAA